MPKFIFTDKIGLKIAICCQINYFKSILYVKFNFESIGDNFEATGLFLEILTKNQEILMKTAFIFENKIFCSVSKRMPHDLILTKSYGASYKILLNFLTKS